jgi:YHS domain-containing protein
MENGRCAVCGLSANSKIIALHKGKQYKLCSYRCKKRFEADEERYVEPISKIK